MADTMSAIGSFEGLPVSDERCLVDVELPVPELRPQDVLVRVQAVSVNPVDVKRRASLERSDTPTVLGYDAAGVVEAIGADVSTLGVGDEVFYAGDVTRQGSNAELQAVDERIVAERPGTLSFADAAALPLTSLTASEALFDRLRLTRESTGTLLILGAAGGVGSIMVQLAKLLTGVTVIGTASRGASRDWVAGLGADAVIDHHDLVNECGRDGARRDRLRVQPAHGGQHRVVRRDHEPVRRDRRDRRARGPRAAAAQAQVDRLSLGVHVHPLDVRDARHDRAEAHAGSSSPASSTKAGSARP